MNHPQTAQESLQYLRRCLTAAQAEPNNTFLVTQLEAAVSIHNAAEYLEDRERRHARDLKQATLPEGYTLLRGEEHPGYEHGWTAPNGRGASESSITSMGSLSPHHISPAVLPSTHCAGSSQVWGKNP